jgi:choline kinase
MEAIILAAGIGRRLASAHTRPKCLLEFGGRSLLARHLECLGRSGIGSITLCLGYQSDLVEAHLKTLGIGIAPRVLLNPEFERGSILSLWSTRSVLRSGASILLMDADVLYSCALLRRLIDTRIHNCFLLDTEFEAGEEPVKLCIAGRRVVEFRKRIAPLLEYDLCGESVGFFRFSAAMAARLARRCEQYRQQGRLDEPYEEAIRDLLLEFPEAFGYEDVSGMPWIEIDFPEDLLRAETDVLPEINE